MNFYSTSDTIADMMMASSSGNGVQRVQEALEGLGYGFQVEILPDSTRSAQEAAQAIGCTLGQIAKSLIFQTESSERAVLVIASGKNQVDEKKMAKWVGAAIRKANAGFVRQVTGYAIGGVPPVGHKQEIETFIDQDLFAYDTIWAAAGTPHAVFKLTGEILARITGGRVIQLSR
jgi:Cys-tRNA(Pro) deacylase